MNIIETEDFKKDFKDLPISVKKFFQKQKAIFKQNWLDSRLHTKIIKELPGVYSFRVTRRYRIIFYFRNDDAIFFKIGHRKDIYE